MLIYVNKPIDSINQSNNHAIIVIRGRRFFFSGTLPVPSL